MRQNPKFLSEGKPFWACVKTLSQQVGYSKGGKLLTPTGNQMAKAFSDLNLNASVLYSGGKTTHLGEKLQQYFSYRSDVLHTEVEPSLMNAADAQKEFHRLKDWLKPRCPLPMNKQKGDKKDYNFLTGLVNMTVEANAEGLPCDFDPRELTTITSGDIPCRTLSRRVDGAFPSAVNPIAIWEIKEYYYTTTFGSRIADGVYETLLDGLELEELNTSEKIFVEHYLMVDAYDTWWNDGKSYLCRMVDMLNMGYVDEVLFGKQVITELPRIVKGWVSNHANSKKAPPNRLL